MGRPFGEAWHEIAKEFEPIWEKGDKHGIATSMDCSLFFLERNGYLEETYFMVSDVLRVDISCHAYIVEPSGHGLFLFIPATYPPGLQSVSEYISKSGSAS